MKSGKIFINYRREDSRADAGRLYDRLQARYPGRIFRDVGSLEPGIEWREAIDKVLGDSDACIVVIGKNWLTMTDATGRRRLDDPRDTVRQELQTALGSDMRVFPILVGGAKMPAEEDLPADLQALARRNALEITEQDWNEDFEKLVAALERALGWSAPKAAKSGSGSRTALYVVGGFVVTVLGLGIIGTFVGNKPDTPVNPAPVVIPVKPPDVAPDSKPDVKPEVRPPIAEVPPTPARPQRARPAPAVAPITNDSVKPARFEPAVVPDPPPPIEPRRPIAVDNAQDALSAGRLVSPRSDSALHWALQAQQNGEPGANNVLQRVNQAILNHMQTLSKGKQFDEELAFLSHYADYYPPDSPMHRTIQQVRDQIRQAQRGVRLQVIHRHGIDYRTARCEGWLEIDPQGTVSYACDPQFVHDARCDRVTFPPGAFTYKSGGEQLRVSAPGSGNYDFFAPPPTIEQAASALSASGARLQQK